MHQDNRITGRALIIGTLFAGFFAVLTSYLVNRAGVIEPATQIAVLPYALLLLTVLLINPVIRLLRVCRAFSLAEILIIFIMGTVSSGISIFGLASQLVPIIHGAYNEHWNNEQTEWAVYVEPFVNEAFFISEPGVQDAAAAYREKLIEVRKVRSHFELALNIEKSQAALNTARDELERVSTKTGITDEQLAAHVGRARSAVETAEKIANEYQSKWQDSVSDVGIAATSTTEVVRDFPSRLAQLDAELAERKAALRALEKKAFAKVARFRRGLSEDERAFPGIMPLAGETFTDYKNRFLRLRIGTAALSDAERAGVALNDGTINDATTHLTNAISTLQPIADRQPLSEAKAALDERWNAVNTELNAIQEQLTSVRNKRRLATADSIEPLDAEMRELTSKALPLKKTKGDLTHRQENIRAQLKLIDKVVAVSNDLSDLEKRLAAGEVDRTSAAAELSAIIPAFRSFDASMERYLIGDVPWRVWAKPLASWGLLIVLTYMVLMTFNVLIFRQWAHNEKLIYPLAELPKVLVGADGDGDQSRIPAIFRSGYFWFGFSVSATFLGYNFLAYTGEFGNMQPLDLYNRWQGYVDRTPFEAVRQYVGKSTIFFTMIGLAFLIPANISFSMWFFIVIYMLQLLILVWSGHGHDERDFPLEWYYTLNFMTAQGGGALMVFAAVVFYKCRHYLFCFFNPASINQLDRDEQRELRTSSFFFVAGSIGLILVLWLYMGANLVYTIFAYFIIMMITIGLIRAVAEGGILGFQAWASPFHLIRSIFGMNKSWTSPSLFAPLFVYYSVLFLDIKTFIAPAMANSIKIRDDLRMKRGRFHLSIILGIGIALIASIATHIMLGYDKGGDAMSNWFYSSFPRGLYNQIASMTKTMPVDNQGGLAWLIVGAVAMTGLLFFRQHFFWLPHPIGLIMLVNPIMRTYWFSIMVGWMAKVLVTKYGNSDSYRHARSAFIGLIIGELTLVILALLVTVWTGKHIPIDLNRN